MAWSATSSVVVTRLVQSMSAAPVRKRGARRAIWLPAIAIALAVAAFFVFKTPAGGHEAFPALDGDLCPTEAAHVAGSATYLLDLRKPLADAGAPGRFLLEVGRDLAAGVELDVFAVTDQPAAPRRLLARLCKPYSEAEIAGSTAKDSAESQRDCNDLPAQVSKRTRDLATRFCARRDALRARIDDIAAAAPGTVANAYLVEALEHTRAAFASRPAPWKLYMFSDLLQHASWYSHLDLRWTDWSYAAFAPRREAALPAAANAPPPAPWQVVVFYPLRQRVTEPLRPRYAHQTFWRRYFETQRAEVAFRELARAPAYYAPPLMVTPTEALAQDIEAVLQDTERRRKAAAELEFALTELDAREALAEVDGPATAAAPASADPPLPPAATQSPEPSPTTGASPQAAEPEVRTPTDGGEPAQANAPLVAAPPPPVAETALATDALALTERLPPIDAFKSQDAPPQRPACVIALKPEFTPALAPGGYPGDRRVSYGAGAVTVRYTVDAAGRTVDADVLANAETQAARPDDSAALARDTAAEVRRWEFSFADANPRDCVLAPRIATFNYVERCVGSPVPTCRTVRGNVAVF